MHQRALGGAIRITAARQVQVNLVRKIPNDLYAVLVIYTHDVFGRANDPRIFCAVEVPRSRGCFVL